MHVIGRVAFDVYKGRAVVRLDDLAVDQRLDAERAFGLRLWGDMARTLLDVEFAQAVAEVVGHDQRTFKRTNGLKRMMSTDVSNQRMDNE